MTTCINNLHQIGIALQLFVDDQEGKYPNLRNTHCIGGHDAAWPWIVSVVAPDEVSSTWNWMVALVIVAPFGMPRALKRMPTV